MKLLKDLLYFLGQKFCSHKKLEKLYSSGYDMGFGCPNCYRLWTFPKAKGSKKLDLEKMEGIGFIKIKQLFRWHNIRIQ